MAAQEIVVDDSLRPCSYLAGQTARLPYRHPRRKLTPREFDQRLAEGDRRTGMFLYRTRCPECSACQPLRLAIDRFRPSATQRRMQRRGDQSLSVKVGTPIVDAQRIRLFNRHRDERGLTHGDDQIAADSYAHFLAHSCCDTVEFAYWHGAELVAVAIADLGLKSMSAVYCFYDPSFSKLSLGTYSILRQVEACRATGRQWLYLGFYIAESPHMVYKGSFRPHQRLIGGKWLDFS